MRLMELRSENTEQFNRELWAMEIVFWSRCCSLTILDRVRTVQISERLNIDTAKLLTNNLLQQQYVNTMSITITDNERRTLLKMVCRTHEDVWSKRWMSGYQRREEEEEDVLERGQECNGCKHSTGWRFQKLEPLAIMMQETHVLLYLLYNDDDF